MLLLLLLLFLLLLSLLLLLILVSEKLAYVLNFLCLAVVIFSIRYRSYTHDSLSKRRVNENGGLVVCVAAAGTVIAVTIVVVIAFIVPGCTAIVIFVYYLCFHHCNC